MSLSTTEAVRRSFLMATRQNLARNLRTAEDWEKFNTIAKETRERIEAEHVAFQQDYETRLADARQVILRENDGLCFDIPRPKHAPSPADKEALDHTADARVRHDHQLRLAAIQSDELDQYQELRDEVRARDERQGQAREAFTRTRNGPTQSQ